MFTQQKKKDILKKEWAVWIALFLLPLLFYPWAIFSAWKSNSDIHALLEFWSSLMALFAGIMTILYFFLTTGFEEYLFYDSRYKMLWRGSRKLYGKDKGLP